jgi:endogenous inhibitor of DNA gyrase (YacG/DUF329 family)
MNIKTRGDMARSGFRSLFVGIGCAPVVLFIFWLAFYLILSVFMSEHTALIISLVIAVGILALFIVGGLYGVIGSMFAKTIDVKCPYCDTANKVLKDVKTFSCKECKQTVLVKEEQGYKLN